MTSPTIPVPTETTEALTFTYTNWRGETALRRVRAHTATFRFDTTEWHPEPQWLMAAVDADKMEWRSFAVRDIVFAASPALASPVPSDAGVIGLEKLCATLAELRRSEHSKLGQLLLDKSEDGRVTANWQGGRVNGLTEAHDLAKKAFEEASRSCLVPSVGMDQEAVAGELRALGAIFAEDESRWQHPAHRTQWLNESPAEYLGWLKGYDAARIALEAQVANLTAERDEAIALADHNAAEAKRLSRIAADRRYMMEAYRAMLGPIGLQVVKMWDEKNVLRQHTSWGPEAYKLTGEQRAQIHLDTEAAPKTPFRDIDEDDPVPTPPASQGDASREGGEAV